MPPPHDHTVTVDPMPRTLILLRHGEAATPAGTPDRQRPLTAHGRTQAAAAGRLIGTAHTVGAVLCSPALRTRQTLEAAAHGADWTAATPARTIATGLYNADAAAVLSEIALVDPDVHTLLVVGHFPGLPQTALALDPHGPLAADVRRGLPTAGHIVVRTDDPWDELPNATWGSGTRYGTIIDVVAP